MYLHPQAREAPPLEPRAPLRLLSTSVHFSVPSRHAPPTTHTQTDTHSPTPTCAAPASTGAAKDEEAVSAARAAGLTVSSTTTWLWSVGGGGVGKWGRWGRWGRIAVHGERERRGRCGWGGRWVNNWLRAACLAALSGLVAGASARDPHLTYTHTHPHHSPTTPTQPLPPSHSHPATPTPLEHSAAAPLPPRRPPCTAFPNILEPNPPSAPTRHALSGAVHQLQGQSEGLTRGQLCGEEGGGRGWQEARRRRGFG